MNMPRPRYKALWEAEKKRADNLLAILNPPRFETAPTNRRITEPVVLHAAPTEKKAWYQSALDGEPLEWSRVVLIVTIITVSLMFGLWLAR